MRAVRLNAAAHSSCSQGPGPAEGPELLLHRLNQALLARTMFPVGELPKTEVRRIAERSACPTRRRRTRPASASSASGPSASSSTATSPTSPARSRTTAAARSASTSACPSTRSASARASASAGSINAVRPGRQRHEPWFVARKDMATNTLYAVQAAHPGFFLARCAPTMQLGGWHAACGRRLRREDALPPGRRALRLRGRHVTRLHAAFRRAAMGGHAGAVGRALRRRGVPGGG